MAAGIAAAYLALFMIWGILETGLGEIRKLRSDIQDLSAPNQSWQSCPKRWGQTSRQRPIGLTIPIPHHGYSGG